MQMGNRRYTRSRSRNSEGLDILFKILYDILEEDNDIEIKITISDKYGDKDEFRLPRRVITDNPPWFKRQKFF